MTAAEKFIRWKQKARDEEIRRELAQTEGDAGEIEDRFGSDLQFGTGGLRGIMGAGSARMNVYTVRRATQGYAAYLLAHAGGRALSAAIGYDSRRNSERFARETAAVFAANGIKAYIYPELMPTPALSFAVRELGCAAGVNITASHNPAPYNGYKAYGPDGCQLSGEGADAVLAEMLAADCFDGVKTMPFEEGLRTGRIEWISEAVSKAYLERVLAEQARPGSARGSGLRVAYTPLNGAGRRSVLTVLEKIGVVDIFVVPEQEFPDGDFPTCPYPNPEAPQALALGLKLALEKGADLLVATDPDSDRVIAAVVRDGKERIISGNEMGCLLLDYIAAAKTERGIMPPHPTAVRSLVSTPMADAIAAAYGVEMRSVLTGFKYIGEQIAQLEAAGEEESFLFGFEESCGYLTAGYARDKDAVCAAMLICEMAAWYKTHGTDLISALDRLYEKYGCFLDRVDSHEFPGARGMTEMQAIMERLRREPPESFDACPVTSRTDYQAAVRICAGEKKPTGLPCADILEYELGEAGRVIVRPSGTEPKLKIYYAVRGKTREQAQVLLKTLRAAAQSTILGKEG